MSMMNKVYNMNNIDLLYRLESDGEKIDLIYCDVLYNTGNTFLTKDNNFAYVDNIGNDEEVEAYYTKFFDMCHRVLSDKGSIFIQCDYRISWIIQKCMNKYFTFNDKIIWKKSQTGKGAKSKKSLSKDYDEIFFYTKTKNYVFNQILKPHDITSLKEYKYQDEKGYFKIVTLGMYSKLSIQKMEDDGLIYTTKSGKKYVKYYLKDMNDGVFSNIWCDCSSLYNGKNGEMNTYPTQKPKALLERIISMYSNENDIVADFFCGSGTTLVVAKELNRRYIGCDIGDEAIKITCQRLSEL